ncbi:MAG TPA: thioredoxin domain-containing protein [Candidatus Acidoferrales bacterium]|nr:thioredoxin domain-containing protein [Candidatus Acidoferrales bacterium]
MSTNNEKPLTTKLIPIAQMDCSTCIPILEKEILKLNGVKEARANYLTKMIKVVYDSDLVRLPEIESAVEKVGYQIAYKKYPSAASKLKGLFRKEKPGLVKVISDADFASKVLRGSKTVAVLFSSAGCPACHAAKSVYAETAEDLAGRAELYEMDISSSEIWHNYEILNIPTILIFRDGKLQGRLIALPQKTEIIEALTK